MERKERKTPTLVIKGLCKWGTYGVRTTGQVWERKAGGASLPKAASHGATVSTLKHPKTSQPAQVPLVQGRDECRSIPAPKHRGAHEGRQPRAPDSAASRRASSRRRRLSVTALSAPPVLRRLSPRGSSTARKEREPRPPGWGVSQPHPGPPAPLRIPGLGLTATVVHLPAGLWAPDLLSSMLQNHPLSSPHKIHVPVRGSHSRAPKTTALTLRGKGLPNAAAERLCALVPRLSVVLNNPTDHFKGEGGKKKKYLLYFL